MFTGIESFLSYEMVKVVVTNHYGTSFNLLQLLYTVQFLLTYTAETKAKNDTTPRDGELWYVPGKPCQPSQPEMGVCY